MSQGARLRANLRIEEEGRMDPTRRKLCGLAVLALCSAFPPHAAPQEPRPIQKVWNRELGDTMPFVEAIAVAPWGDVVVSTSSELCVFARDSGEMIVRLELPESAMAISFISPTQ